MVCLDLGTNTALLGLVNIMFFVFFLFVFDVVKVAGDGQPSR